MNLNKILTIVIGFTVLAGLALHQGKSERVSRVDESVLVGTALMRPANAENASAGDGEKDQGRGESDCPSMITPAAGEEIEECPPVAENEQMESAASREVQTSQG